MNNSYVQRKTSHQEVLRHRHNTMLQLPHVFPFVPRQSVMVDRLEPSPSLGPSPVLFGQFLYHNWCFLSCGLDWEMFVNCMISKMKTIYLGMPDWFILMLNCMTSKKKTFLYWKYWNEAVIWRQCWLVQHRCGVPRVEENIYFKNKAAIPSTT